ncbi:hypothetical protein PRZ48_010332 [Zasmidium cellare]|uniref:Uncharacterized protein n=1 Tax=Zasmidium cellare TaxID=395010 RepID=A0ABR0E8C4_ZASCE|nr:hypothetical protein PRZ48_010332 [Zasmidium cellare]
MANNGPPRPDIYWPPNSEYNRLKAEDNAADQSGDPARVAAVDAEIEYFMVQRHVWRVFNPGWVRPNRTIEQSSDPMLDAPPTYNAAVHLVEADRMAQNRANHQSTPPRPDIYFPPTSEHHRLRAELDESRQAGDHARLETIRAAIE